MIVTTDGATDGAADTATGLLYLGGLALALAAAIGTGLRARRGRRTLVAVGLSVAVVAWIMGVGDLVEPVVDAFSDTQYVIHEAMILVIGLALLALGALSRRRETV